VSCGSCKLVINYRKRPSRAHRRERHDALRRCNMGPLYGFAHASGARGSALGVCCFVLLGVMSRGGRQTKDCSQTWSFGFQFRLGKHFSDERGLPFYYLKIAFLEYLRTSGEIRYPNGPIGNWKKLTIWKEACIVHVGAVIHKYQGEGASWSRKCLWWKDCPGYSTSLNTNNVNFCTQSRPYQREASRPSGPEYFFLVNRHTASAPSSSGTHLGGVK